MDYKPWNLNFRFLLFTFTFLLDYRFPGDYSDGATPLPFPNREVKPISADGTALVTGWESRSSPGFFFFRPKSGAEKEK